MVQDIKITKKAERSLRLFPQQVAQKLLQWISSVKFVGLEETRKNKGFHDEPLQGRLFGLRSIRLNLKYRAIYRIVKDQTVYIEIVEVTAHDYKK